MKISDVINLRLRPILQSENAECGLACLVMIASYYGFESDLPTMRRMFSASVSGANLGQIIKIASNLNLDARAVRIELEQLQKLTTPCVIHWNLNHVVVLERMLRNGGALIIDPALGRRRISKQDLSDSFTGVAIEFTKSAAFVPKKDKQIVKLIDLIGNAAGIKRNFLIIAVISIIIELSALATPILSKITLDHLDYFRVNDTLSKLMLLFMGVVVFQASNIWLRSKIITWLGISINLQWSRNVFRHMLNLPIDFFKRRHLGDIVSKFTSITSIQQTVTTSFVTSLLDGAISLISLAIVASIFPKVGFIATISLLIYLVLRVASQRHLMLASNERISHGAKMQTELMESVRGIQTIKIFQKESQRLTRFYNYSVATANRNLTVQRITANFTATAALIFGLENILALWAMIASVISNKITAGMLVAIFFYLNMFNLRAAAFIDKLADFKTLRIHLERLADIVLSSPEAQAEARYSGAWLSGSLDLHRVSFRYSPSDPWIIKNFSLSVDPGESVAIVGPSGVGKTTVAKLILGLLDPTEGEVRYAGINVAKIGKTNFRSRIAAVMQDDCLFSGSIADNIAFFDENSNMEKIVEAAQAANIHNEITKMIMGYETVVGDMGSALSGGQIQRILLARALYQRPEIILLDEATSHLDIENERMVNESIRQLRITRVVIAHRPETIASAGRIIKISSELSEEDGVFETNSN